LRDFATRNVGTYTLENRSSNSTFAPTQGETNAKAKRKRTFRYADLEKGEKVAANAKFK